MTTATAAVLNIHNGDTAATLKTLRANLTTWQTRALDATLTARYGDLAARKVAIYRSMIAELSA